MTTGLRDHQTPSLEERMAKLLGTAARMLRETNAGAALAEEMARVSQEWRTAHDEATRHVPSDAEADLARVFIQARMSVQRVEDAAWKAAVDRFRETARAYPKSVEAALTHQTTGYLELHIADAFRDARLALAQAPIDPTASFFVAHHHHPDGVRVRLFANTGDAEMWRQEIAAQGWNDYMSDEERQPLDPGLAANVFFEVLSNLEDADDRHSFEVIEMSIEKPFTPDLPVGWRLCESRDAAYDCVFGAADDPFNLPSNVMLTGPAASAADYWLYRENSDWMLISVRAEEAERWKLVPVDTLPEPISDFDGPQL